MIKNKKRLRLSKKNIGKKKRNDNKEIYSDLEYDLGYYLSKIFASHGDLQKLEETNRINLYNFGIEIHRLANWKCSGNIFAGFITGFVENIVNNPLILEQSINNINYITTLGFTVYEKY